MFEKCILNVLHALIIQVANAPHFIFKENNLQTITSLFSYIDQVVI